MESQIDKIIQDQIGKILKKKHEVLNEKLKEKGYEKYIGYKGIFPKVVCEKLGENETYYADDGTDYGERIVTFIFKQPEFDYSEDSTSDFKISFSYY